jgi:shikimate dehydrogenase
VTALPQLSGHTVPYAVLGHPIGHSLSPVMHNASFRALGLDAIYLAFDVRPDRLAAVLPAMRAMGFGGVNLTVPLKEVAFRMLDALDDTAERLGAVNTVEMTPDGLRGHNTDGDGFLAALREAFGHDAAGAAVFILGAGGAGRAVALSCAVNGASRITLADLDAARMRNLAEAVRAAAPGTDAACVDAGGDAAAAAARAADLVVQCSPAGMRPDDPSPLPPAAFRAGQCAFDLVYMYPRTAFMRAAEAAGARAANGLGMLLHQGARAYTLWSGKAADTAAMRTALEQAVYGRGE